MTGARGAPQLRSRSGQTVVEYILLIGIVTVALTVMGPFFKRGLQSMVKVTSDQIGDQRNADQDIVARDPAAPVEGVSYLINSLTNATANVTKSVRTGIIGEVDGKNQDLGYMEIGLNEATNTTTDAATDLGFTPRQ